MRIIPEEYWSHFVKIGSDGYSEIRDGQKFEDLVLSILKCLYRYKNITWCPTKKTHDGNKDIVGVCDEKVYWAECKNYSSKIDLKTLAATLVMAEIENVNEVLFFCYSDINDNTKKKLFCYSRSTGRPVYFYDGAVLDQLILQYKEQLFPVYFPELVHEQLFVDNCDKKPVFLSYIERNPFTTGYVTFEKNDLSELQNLQLGEIIGINLVVINRDINNPLHVKYYLTGDFAHNFTVLNCDVAVDGMKVHFKDFVVKPGQIMHRIVYLRYDRFSPFIWLPQIYVGKEAISLTGSISSLGSRYVSFLGKNYTDIVSDVKHMCLGKNRLSLALFFGSSGTGKSRLLRECSECFLGNGYKILNFNYGHTVSDKRGNLSLYTLLQELILVLYGLDDEILTLIAENEIDRMLVTERSGRLEIIRIIFENRINLDKLDKTIFIPIFEKMISDKIVYLIDDLQGCDESVIEFWKSFLDYSLNLQRKVTCVLILAINTDMLHSMIIKEWMLHLQQLRHSTPYTYYEKEVTGFENTGRAALYLKECLGLDEDINLPLSGVNISLRPKYLLELANLLVDKKIVQFNGETPFITDEVEFRINASYLQSVSLNDVIKERWAIYCDSNSSYIEEKSKAILSYLLFVEELDASSTNLSQDFKDTLISLCESGFIKRTPGFHNYIFEHDAIKNFFLGFYSDWMEYAMEIIATDQIGINNDGTLKFLCDICSHNIISEEEINQYISLEFPAHIQTRADEKIISYLLEGKYDGENLYLILRNILKHSREYLGEECTERLYRIIEKRYVKNSKIISDAEYCSLLQDYAENQLKLKNTSISIKIYKKILKINNDERIRCILYNRWFVCGRVGGKIHQYNKYWKWSFSLAEKNKYYDLYIENLFDKAQSYFLDNKKKNYALELLCSGCKFYEEHPISYLLGHYLYRKIQIDFIMGNYSQLGEEIDNANMELMCNPEIGSKLFFKVQFTIFEIMYGMIHDQTRDIISLLNELNMQQRMQNPKQMYRCYYLYAKYYLSQNVWDKGLAMYKKTFENIFENSSSEEIHLQYEFIMDDMIYNIFKHHLPVNKYDFSYFSSLPGWQDKNTHIYLGDFDSYYTKAIVCGCDKKDGYLLF